MIRKHKGIVSRIPVELKWLKCSKPECGEEVEVAEEVVAVTCWRCAMKRTEAPVVIQPADIIEGPKRPSGWHFMKVYVDAEGNVFHRGVEKPKLKGTKKPTIIKAKKTQAERDTAAEKKQAKLAKLFKKKQEMKKENGNGIKSLVENTLPEEQEVESVSTS